MRFTKGRDVGNCEVIEAEFVWGVQRCQLLTAFRNEQGRYVCKSHIETLREYTITDSDDSPGAPSPM